MKRPKLLQHEDAVQDYVEENGAEGLTILQIVAALSSNYATVYHALRGLRLRNRVKFERRNRVHYYFPN